MTRTPHLLTAGCAALALIIAGCGSSGPSDTTAAANGQKKSSKAAKFSQCMRDNGVSAFPDPDASGELTLDGAVNGSSIDPEAPAFDEALAACKDLQPSGFTGKKRSSDQQASSLQFAQCIRDNGVKDFPDPTPDSPLVDTNRIPSSNEPGGMDVLNAAMRVCGDKFNGKLGLTRP